MIRLQRIRHALLGVRSADMADERGTCVRKQHAASTPDIGPAPV
jgi:hypothetical protein